MRKLSTFVIIAFALIAVGASSYAQVSTATVLFLRIAAGARAAGMGETYVAISDDATATHWNPAGLGQYPLSPKWFNTEIPDDLKPLRRATLFEGEGSIEDFQNFDIWALSAQGLIKFDGEDWVKEDRISTQRDQTIETILRRYTGRVGAAEEQKIPELATRVAGINNAYPREIIDSLRDGVMAGLDEKYSNRDEFDSIFVRLDRAYNECHIDWHRFEIAKKNARKALRDSVLSETEADRTLFDFEKAISRFLPRELTIPFEINFEGKLNDITSNDDYLWIASDSGLYRYNGKSWQWFGLPDGLPTAKINKIDIYRNKVFLATDTGLVVYESGAFTYYGPEEGLPREPVTMAIGAAKDRIWAVVGNDLYLFDGIKWNNYFEAEVGSGTDIDEIYNRMKIYNTDREKEAFIEKFMQLNPEDSTERAAADTAGAETDKAIEKVTRVVDSLGVISAIDLIERYSTSESDTALSAEESVSGIVPEGQARTVKVPFVGGFEFEVLDMEVDQYDNLWIGTRYGLLKFMGRKWSRYGYRDFTPDEDIAIFDLALTRVRGDSTRAERLVRNIRNVNRLDSDTIKADQTVMVYANPAGSAINDIQRDGAKLIFATSSGTIVFDGIWQRYKERNLGKRNTVTVKEKNNNVWFVTRDDIEIIARTKSEITGMHVQLVPELADDIYYEFLGYVQNVEGWGTIGGNITFLSYGKVIRTNTQGQELGDFSPFELAFTLSYGTQLTPKLSGGISAKIIYSHLSTLGAGYELGKGTATGLAIDLGLLYNISNRLTLGMALTNLGPEISYIDVSQSDPLPRNLAIGLAWKVIKSSYNQVTFAIDANKSLADREQTILEDFRDVIASPQTELKGILFNPFSLGNWSKEFRNVIVNTGIEYKYGQFIAFRAGYIHDEIGDVKTPTLGVGLAISMFNFDLAYIPTSDENPGVSNTMKISISADW